MTLRPMARYYTSANSRVIGHEGAELGIATMSYLDLETGVGAIVLTNGDFGQGGGFEQAVERIVNHCLEIFGKVEFPGLAQTLGQI